jgi:hypothetical protein
VLAFHVGFHVIVGFLDIAGNVEGIARGFGDGETVVEGDTGGDRTETWGYN